MGEAFNVDMIHLCVRSFKKMHIFSEQLLSRSKYEIKTVRNKMLCF